MAKLFVWYSEFQDSALAKAKIWGMGSSEMKEASTLKEMAAAISKHKQLDELVLFFHGSPGGISFDEEGYAFSDAEFQKAFTKGATKIDKIRLEGCWVGEAPDEMVHLGRLFNSKLVSAFTWVSASSVMTIDVPRGATEASMRKELKHFERWFAKGSPTLSQMAQQAGKKKILLEWFQSDVLNTSPPYEIKNGATQTNFDRLGKHKYRLRSEATDRSVPAAQAVRNKAVPPPFEYVTVTL